MNQSAMIGARIRALRQERNMTLKQLAEESGLSVGFLSQLERGISSVAIDLLAQLADILDVSLQSFFDLSQETDPVVHGFDLRSQPISPQIIQYVLSHNVSAFDILPRLFVLQPMPDVLREEDIKPYSHAGEEFAYVLEGIVTVLLEGQRHTLYPGDSIQIRSNASHNWFNLTNRTARLLTVNVPNPFGAGVPDDQKEALPL